jgi:hypothetical protein
MIRMTRDDGIIPSVLLPTRSLWYSWYTTTRRWITLRLRDVSFRPGNRPVAGAKGPPKPPKFSLTLPSRMSYT